MIVVIMGVVGAGKTTIGRLLAEQFGWEFADADDYHPPANIEKIRHGIPLTDEDRLPWLQRLHKLISGWNSQQISGVLACSALKSGYREYLRTAADLRWVYLHGSAELIAQRLRARHGHFANDQILLSQFADLEEPDGAIRVEIDQSPERIVSEIRDKLGLS
jgi:gluconokinase